MAGTTRLELATSCVTGMRSNQLSYAPMFIVLNFHFWSVAQLVKSDFVSPSLTGAMLPTKIILFSLIYASNYAYKLSIANQFQFARFYFVKKCTDFLQSAHQNSFFTYSNFISLISRPEIFDSSFLNSTAS